MPNLQFSNIFGEGMHLLILTGREMTADTFCRRKAFIFTRSLIKCDQLGYQPVFSAFDVLIAFKIQFKVLQRLFLGVLDQKEMIFLQMSHLILQKQALNKMEQ